MPRKDSLNRQPCPQEERRTDEHGKIKIPQTIAMHSEAPGSRFVYIAAAFAALGGLLFGYDTGVISGAELFIKNEFTLSTFALEVIVSGVLAGAAIGALAGGRLADLFGRRKLLIATAIIFAAGSDPLRHGHVGRHDLIVGRIIVGLGIGLSSGTVPVYISEVSPAEARGWQVPSFSWRLPSEFFWPTWWTMPLRKSRAGAGCLAWRWFPRRSLHWECSTCRKARAGWP